MKFSGYIIWNSLSFCILPTSTHIVTIFPFLLHYFNYNYLLTFILFSYRYQYVPARIDSDGYAYFGLNHGWRWYENLTPTTWYDDNEYDLLVERPAEKIEILELDYEEVLYNETKKYEEPEESNSEHGVVHSNCDYKKSSMIRTTLTTSSTESKTWTHSVQFGILRSSTITVNFIACVVE